MVKTITVHTKTTSYRIHIRKNIAAVTASYLRRMDIGNYCVLVTQKNIIDLHKKRIRQLLKDIPHTVITVPQGEKAKSEKCLFSLLKKIAAADTLKRRVFIACVGGGVVCDLGGFAASIYKRGIPHVTVPTTLLAQVDAAIGGKTAINLPDAKNIIGTFYQPGSVFIDSGFLETLPPREIAQGMAEIIKYAAIRDKRLFDILDRECRKIKDLDPALTAAIVEKCVRIKAAIVSRDERETLGLRTLLNFGHTAGHALESSCAYGARLTHGEAVALGMMAAAFLSFNRGVCAHKDVEDLYRVIRAYGLPTAFPFHFRKVLACLMHDKKFVSGNIRMVLLERVGKAVVCEKIPLKSIKNSLKYIQGPIDK